MYILKYFNHVILAFSLILFPASAHALSFAPGTEFIDAKTKEECIAKGGNFIKWYNETYCTRSSDKDRKPKDLNEKKDALTWIIGKSLRKAKKRFPNRIFRVVKKDGEHLIVTKDFRPGRINVELRRGRIVDFRIEGRK